MMTGATNSSLEAIIEVLVLGPAGQTTAIQGVVDTGFDGWLTLPENVVTKLDLNWRGRGRAQLADGSETVFDRYDATVKWHSMPRRIMIDCANIKPLIGMALLKNSELRIQVLAGGTVTIELLPNLL